MAVPHRSKSKRQRPDAVRRRTKVSSNPPLEVELDPRNLNPVDLGAVRQQVTNLVGNRALEVVHQILDQIGRGNYQAMKYLFEMVGLFPAATSEGTPAEDSLAQALLNDLGIPGGSSSSGEAAQRESEREARS